MSLRFQIAAVLLLVLGCFNEVHAQQLLVFPHNRDGNLRLEALLNNSEQNYHTSFKPLLRKRVADPEFKDFDEDTTHYYYWFTQKLFKENLVQVEEEGFYLTANPLFNLELGFDASDTSTNVYYDNPLLINNSRGFIVEGQIGEKIAFSTSFWENQTIGVDYLYDYAVATGVYPGQGRVKQYKDSAGWDYAMSSGVVSYQPTKRAQIQFGHDKNFVGEGYRSMLLSDNSFNYPALKGNFLFGRFNEFQYTSVLASMQSLDRFADFSTPEALFKRKMGSFHYFSANIGKKLQVGLFEGTIWERVDDEDKLVMDYTYFVPVVGLATALNGFSGRNNSLLGLNFKLKLDSIGVLYGQFAVDDPSETQFAFQAGGKFFDIFGIRDFHAQVEYNQVLPYMYTHDKTLQNYSHYNQALAHPLGAGFGEVVTIVNYDLPKNRFFLRGQVNVAWFEADVDTLNLGTNIFTSYQTADVDEIGTGAPSTLLFADFQFGYQMLKWTNMQWVFGMSIRNLSSEYNGESTGHSTSYIYFGLRTNLTNRYYDF